MMEMKMFDGRWNNKVYYKLGRDKKKDNGFMKRKPYSNVLSYAEITPWVNGDSHKSLWVKLNYYDDKYIICSSEDIIELAEVLKKLKRIPSKRWKNETD